MTTKYKVAIKVLDTWRTLDFGDTVILDTENGAEFLMRQCKKYRPDEDFAILIIKGDDNERPL